MKIKLPFFLGTALLLAVGGSVTAADDAPARTPRPAGEFRRGDQNGNMRGLIAFAGAYSAIMREMSEEQRSTLMEAMQDVSADARDVSEKLRTARKEMEDAIYSAQPDPEVIRKDAAVIGEMEAKMGLLRAKVFAKIRPMLTPEQLEKVEKTRREFGEGIQRRLANGPANQSPSTGATPQIRRPGYADDAPVGSDVRRPKPPPSDQK